MAFQTAFKLRRLIDDLEYDFVKQKGNGKDAVYLRVDEQVRVYYHVKFGWCAWDEENDCLSGRVWDIPPDEQGGMPSEGVWVSCKGSKSYVYKLEFILGKTVTIQVASLETCGKCLADDRFQKISEDFEQSSLDLALFHSCVSDRYRYDNVQSDLPPQYQLLSYAGESSNTIMSTYKDISSVSWPLHNT